MEDISNKLIDLHDRLKALKQMGIKMKDIAEVVDLAPSVLSALNTTVLPIYISSLSNYNHAEALDYAISHVNNVSKRKLLSNLDKIHHDLKHYNTNILPQKTELPFVGRLLKEANHEQEITTKIDGVYMSYSQSSVSNKMLKAEPFLIYRNSESNNLLIMRKNTSGNNHDGFAIYKEHQAMHIYFNEATDTFFAPVNIILQLPFVDDFSVMRGLYLGFDVIKNPIARRIVLHKVSDDASVDSFENFEAKLIPLSELNQQEELFANYTCEGGDAIKTYSFPAHTSDVADLAKEKEFLGLLGK